MRARGSRVKVIGEILRFVGHQSVTEFHDAHRIGWYAVISQYEFGDPEIAAADNAPDRKTLLVGLDESALLNVVPAADPLARLRIIQHGILAVDFMFDLEIARVRSIPMALQRHPHDSIIHLNLPPALPAIISGTSLLRQTPADKFAKSRPLARIQRVNPGLRNKRVAVAAPRQPRECREM